LLGGLIGKGLRAPQLPVVNGAVVRAFGNVTKSIKGQALNGFEINDFSYEKIFMTVTNLVLDAIIGINFLRENKVVINLAERCFETRWYSSDCELNIYDSLPKDETEVAVISNPEF